MDENQENEKSQSQGLNLNKAGGIFKAKEKAKEGKKTVKIIKAIMKVLIPILIKVVLPVIIVTILVAGFYDIIKGRHRETTTSSYSQALYGYSTQGGNSDGEDDIAGHTINITPGTNGRYNITFDITEAEENSVRYFLDDNNIIGLTDENIKFITALVINGYKLEKYNNRDQLQALLLFFKADIASQSLDLRTAGEMYIDGKYNPPNFDEEGIPGIVTLKKYRANDSGEIEESVLEYMPEEQFYSITDNSNANNFTVNVNGDLVVANTTQTIITHEYSPNCPNDMKLDDTTTYDSYPNPANYKSLISKSTLPFNLMATLMVYIDDPEFYSGMAETVRNSNIVIGLKEEETIDIETIKTTYTPRTEKYYDIEEYKYKYVTEKEVTRTVEDNRPFETKKELIEFLQTQYGYQSALQQNMEWEYNDAKYTATYNYKEGMFYLTVKQTAMEDKTTVVTDEARPLKLTDDEEIKYTTLETSDDFDITTIITNKSYEQGLDIKEIKNWFMNYNIENYIGSRTVENGEPEETILNEEYKGNENYITDFLENAIPINLDYTDNVIENFKKEKEDEVPDAKSFTWIAINGKIYQNTENIETKNSIKKDKITTSIVNGEATQEFRNSGDEGSFLYYFNNSEIAKASFNSARGLIFEQLEKDETTVDQVNILKYLLYLYTGDEYFNTTVPWETMVGGIGFQSFMSSMGIEDYIAQFTDSVDSDKITTCERSCYSKTFKCL